MRSFGAPCAAAETDLPEHLEAAHCPSIAAPPKCGDVPLRAGSPWSSVAEADAAIVFEFAKHGVDSSGAWRTAPLKEYPPAMCAAIAEVLSNVISSFPQCQAQEPLPSELQLWNHLCATHYGTHIGADFVAKR